MIRDPQLRAAFDSARDAWDKRQEQLTIEDHGVTRPGRDLGDSRSPRAPSEIGTDALPGPAASVMFAQSEPRDGNHTLLSAVPQAPHKETP